MRLRLGTEGGNKMAKGSHGSLLDCTLTHAFWKMTFRLAAVDLIPNLHPSFLRCSNVSSLLDGNYFVMGSIVNMKGVKRASTCSCTSGASGKIALAEKGIAF